MTVPSNTYDAVIVGGGHNGLVAACYLARAGYNVCILERYKDVGGAAFSEEIEGAPGHIASTGSYVLSLAPQKVLNDLDLFNNGVEMIKRNPRAFAPTLDGQDGILLWERHGRHGQGDRPLLGEGRQGLPRLRRHDRARLRDHGQVHPAQPALLRRVRRRVQSAGRRPRAEVHDPGRGRRLRRVLLRVGHHAGGGLAPWG